MFYFFNIDITFSSHQLIHNTKCYMLTIVRKAILCIQDNNVIFINSSSSAERIVD